jgi:hypothetical protein
MQKPTKERCQVCGAARPLTHVVRSWPEPLDERVSALPDGRQGMKIRLDDDNLVWACRPCIEEQGWPPPMPDVGASRPSI